MPRGSRRVRRERGGRAAWERRRKAGVVTSTGRTTLLLQQAYVYAVFSFLYLKKLKFQKYMSVLENFKNIPRSPSHRATGPLHGPVAHPEGDRDLFVIKIFTTRLLKTYL